MTTHPERIRRHYSGLKPLERFRLALAAIDRSDEAEADALGRTCPRYTYRMGDVNYHRLFQSAHRTVDAFSMLCMAAETEMAAAENASFAFKLAGHMLERGFGIGVLASGVPDEENACWRELSEVRDVLARREEETRSCAGESLARLRGTALAFERIAEEEGLTADELLALFPPGREWLADAEPNGIEQETIETAYRAMRCCWDF